MIVAVRFSATISGWPPFCTATDCSWVLAASAATYVLASRAVQVDDAYVDREARKGTLPSDHAPIVVDCTLTT